MKAVQLKRRTVTAVCTASNNDLTSSSLNCFKCFRLFRCEARVDRPKFCHMPDKIYTRCFVISQVYCSVLNVDSDAELVVVVVVVTFFNHNFVNCKATLILAIKIYEVKYNISLNDIHT